MKKEGNMVQNGWDDVNGFIVGGDDNEYKQYYTFHREQDKTCIGSGNFCNDKEAEDFVKNRWPEEYKKGVEMRCHEGRTSAK